MIPYRTSYHTERWGFCLPERRGSAARSSQGSTTCVIDTSSHDGSLSYGELHDSRIGSGDEILLSTYICHP